MLHKCSTDCIRKGLKSVNDLQSHLRLLPFLLFDRPYLLVFNCKYISILTVFEILTLSCQKIKTSRDLDHAYLGELFVITKLTLLGPTRAQSLTILFSDISRKFKGCIILKWITWPGPRLFHGWSAVWRLTFNAFKHTKFDDSSFSRYTDISGVCEILECVTWPWPRPLIGYSWQSQN